MLGKVWPIISFVMMWWGCGVSPCAAAEDLNTQVALVPFVTSAFPYDGTIPTNGRPFLDAADGERRGHTAPRAGVLWQDKAYSDRRVLMVVPTTFERRAPALVAVFFHGNRATLSRDVILRQQVVDQFVASRLNAVLLAPQFAVDALDSSAGQFWVPGHLSAFLDEGARRLSALTSRKRDRQLFSQAPVVLIAYSGGYLPAAFSLESGGANNRIIGVVLFDALYDEYAKFADWIEHRGAGFFVSVHSTSSMYGNAKLQRLLRERHIAYQTQLPTYIRPGAVIFVNSGDVVHEDFLTTGLTGNPVSKILGRIYEYRPAKLRD